MSDRWMVVVAFASVAGAFYGRGPGLWWGCAVVAAALASRRPPLLAVAVFVLAGGAAASAAAGLVPVDPGPYHGWVTLLTDPDATRAGIGADVRLDDGRHVQASAFASGPVGALRTTSAGERLLVDGRLSRPPPGAGWLAPRHLVGSLTITAIARRARGAPWVQLANGLRAVLERGAVALPTRERSLFLGFVLGDTRGQPPDIADDFRGAGLSHLLAVSGQNVAFVLALAAPVLRRFGLRTRLPATVVVISFFALVTRFEPSVLRASVMAALAATAATIGRPSSSGRILAMAVTVLVVVDPFLVRSAGFQLSVAACIGIVWIAPRLARALPGPRVIVDPLAVTLGAQAGVAPLLVAMFGGVPLMSVPANLLAAPTEAPVMVWGLGAGVVAGLVGGPAATVLHWPTHALIAWIAWVAHTAATVPAGELGGREVAVGAIAAAVGAAGRHWRIGIAQWIGAVLGVVVVVAPVARLHAARPTREQITTGALLWNAGATVLDLDGRVDAERLLEGLRRRGVRAVDVVVVRTEGPAVRVALDALGRRIAIGQMLSPSTTPTARSLDAGALRIDIVPRDGRLEVDIAVVRGESARGPPV